MAFITDSLGTGLTCAWGTSKIVGTYSGALFQVKKVSNSALTDIIADTDANVASALAAAISGSTGLVTIVYDQMGSGANLTAVSGAEPTVFVDTDGKVSFRNLKSNKKMTTTSTVVKVTNPHVFFVAAPALPDNVEADAPGNGGDPQDFYYYGGGAIGTGRFGLYVDQNNTYVLGSPRNAADFSGQYQMSMAHLGNYHVWDTSHSTVEIRNDTEVLQSPTTTANITYPSTQTLVIGGTVTNARPMCGRWRCFVLYSATQSSTNRNSITNILVTNHGITKLSDPIVSGGFTWTRNYGQPMFQLYGPDVNNMYYKNQCTTYEWGFWTATTTNGVPYHRYEVRPYDTDVILNGSERSERTLGLGGDVDFARGETVEEYFDFRINSAAQNGDWCDIAQIHTSSDNIPDFAVIELKGGVIKHTAQRTPNDTSSSTIAYSNNVWYSCRRRLVVSSSGNADVFQVWMGPHGTTLTLVLDVSGGIFPNASEETVGGYIKEGIYRGFPGTNSGNLVHEIANHQWKKTGTYASYVTSQPPLPTASTNYPLTMAQGSLAQTRNSVNLTYTPNTAKIIFRHRKA